MAGLIHQGLQGKNDLWAPVDPLFYYILYFDTEHLHKVDRASDDEITNWLG